eukprot:gb/GEZJ01001049.1/.p1 GENE.gb/GEZJ01001049.1/~~gb/GEZJ01001049.1/.p1  ORF type:complete len:891 (+),score=154.21 gb/GEZJ01001049.1/:1805-4477(+)
MKHHTASANEAQDRKTLFVRNLHESSTKEDLESHFGGIGPIRHAFLVTTPGSSLCKGYGFVTFAFPEDAERARSILNQSILKGRKIYLDVARKRLRTSNDKLDEQTQQPKARKEDSGQSGKVRQTSALGSVPMRTVLLRKTTGETFAEEEAKDAVGAHLEASGFQACVLTSDGRQARCMYDSWSNAGKAAARAHGGSVDAVIEALKAGQRTTLIVRNLPFRVNEQQLQSVFETIAPIRSMRLAPSSELRKHDIRRTTKNNPNDEAASSSNIFTCAGYAFVEYFLVAHAQTAVKKVNGTKIGGRVIAVDMALSKSQYIAQNANQELDNRTSEAYGLQEGEEADETEENGEDCKAEKTSEEEHPNGQSENKSVIAKLKDKTFRNDQNPEDCISAKPRVVQRPDTKTSERKETYDTGGELHRTVFVRNLLFETSVVELRDAVKERYGNVQRVLLVKDPKTGRPRGTAFVIFKDTGAAKQATGQSSVSESRGLEDRSQVTSTDFVLHGRKLLLSMAVDRSKAKELKTTAPLRTRKNTDSDPRNLRLASVGHIILDSKEARGLSPDDVSRRAKAEKDKQTKLERNPNAFVSEMRLSVRNLPRECDEKALKQIFLLGAQEKNTQTKEEASIGYPKITHVKIVRDAERHDRSKGYGFVQFSEHGHALQALLHLNNNPRMIEWLIKKKPRALRIDEARADLLRKQWRNRRLIVEFAVEDKRIVQVLERVRERGREQAGKKRKKTAYEDHEAPVKKKAKPAIEKPPNTQKNPLVADEQERMKVSSKAKYERRFLHKKKKLNPEELTKPSQSRTDQRIPSEVLIKKPKVVSLMKKAKDDTEKKNIKLKKKESKRTSQDVKFDRLVDEYRKKITSENQGTTGANKVQVSQAERSVRWFENS